MSRLAAAGKTPAEIARWLRATLGPEATYFAFVAAFFQAFQNPLRTLRDTEYWYVGSMTDDQLNDLLSPLVIRTRRSPAPVGMAVDGDNALHAARLTALAGRLAA